MCVCVCVCVCIYIYIYIYIYTYICIYIYITKKLYIIYNFLNESIIISCLFIKAFSKNFDLLCLIPTLISLLL